MINRTLDEWLSWQESLHPRAIDLGLERVREVAQRLELLVPRCRVITVAGTNGKGSCVAMLEAILHAGGYRVGSYTSPHLQRYNERVKLEKLPVSDRLLCDAFARIDAARGDISLSYFEFGTLAAMLIFKHAAVDVMLLEVGLGGRLDAVNIIDADIAVITSIGIDHVEWLGDEREKIGYEKAGIIRPYTPLVCGDPDPPQSIIQRAKELDAPYYVFGPDFGYERASRSHWTWVSAQRRRQNLSLPALQGEIQLQNAATVLMALELLGNRLPLSDRALNEGVRQVELPGRFQRIDGPVETLLDVAHNLDGVEALADMLSDEPVKGRTHAVFAVLADKDVPNMIKAIESQIDHWYLAEAASDRALPRDDLCALFGSGEARESVDCCTTVTDAYTRARASSADGDRILVFGSFYTVAEVLAIDV